MATPLFENFPVLNFSPHGAYVLVYNQPSAQGAMPWGISWNQLGVDMNNENISGEKGEIFGCKAWRRANLGALCKREAEIETTSGMPARGSSKRMAARLGLAPAALSNMIHGVKNIGDEAARSIESKLGETAGSLDIPPFALVFSSAAELEAAKAALKQG